MLIESIVIGGGKPAKLSRINALIGPSNCGKSAALQDVFRLLLNRDPAEPTIESEEEIVPEVLSDVELIKSLTPEIMTRGLHREATDQKGESLYTGLGPTLQSAHSCTLLAETWNVLQRPKLMASAVQKSKLVDLLQLRVTYLNANARATLLKASAANSPIVPPENLLQAFQYADAAMHDKFEAAYRQIVETRRIRLDATQAISLAMRLAIDFPELTDDRAENARQYASLESIDSQSDGIREVASILLSLLMSEGRVVLLDDPASCVPPQVARKLGRWIGSNAERLGLQIVLATHSQAFLSGLLSGSDDVTMIPFHRQGTVTRARSMTHDAVRAMARSPFLSDSETVGCLFSQRAIITQSDEDRAIYQLVAEDLDNSVDVPFVHAHGQQNVAAVTQMLTKAQVAVGVIVDLDVLRREREFIELVEAVTGAKPLAPWLSTREKLIRSFTMSSDHTVLRENTLEVEAFLDGLQQGDDAVAVTSETLDSASAWREIQHRGLDAISDDMRPWVEQLIDELQQRGIFLVPKGQLQGWIDFGGPQSREDWFFNAVNELQMGECPSDLQVFVTQAVEHRGQQAV